MIRDELIGGWLGDSGLPEFRPRFPWWGADLQTVRDAFRPVGSPSLSARPLQVDVGGGDRLLAYLDQPLEGPPLALVLLVHGLGGNSDRGGLLRLGRTLQAAGFAVLRLNLRGAGAGRPWPAAAMPPAAPGICCRSSGWHDGSAPNWELHPAPCRCTGWASPWGARSCSMPAWTQRSARPSSIAWSVSAVRWIWAPPPGSSSGPGILSIRAICCGGWAASCWLIPSAFQSRSGKP